MRLVHLHLDRAGQDRHHGYLRVVPALVVGDRALARTPHLVVVSPGGRVITSPSTQDYAHSERIEGLANGTTYTFTITPTFAYGDGGSVTTAATPRFSRRTADSA